MEPTRVSLLNRLRQPGEERAWEEFYQQYWRVILHYAMKLGLSQDAAQDVLQETMVTLVRKLPEFEYDPSRGKFRNFVLTIVHRKALRAFKRRGRMQTIPIDVPLTDDGQPLIEKIADPDSPNAFKQLEDEWKQSLWEDAWLKLLADTAVEDSSKQIFKAYVIDEQPAPQVAADFNVNENAVYQIKNRLLKRMKREVEYLLLQAERGEE